MRVSEFNITEQYLSEVPMNPTAYAQGIDTGAEKGVLVGFEFEVCVPHATIRGNAGQDTKRTWAEIISTNYDKFWSNDMDIDDISSYVSLIDSVEYNGVTYDDMNYLVYGFLSVKFGAQIKRSFEKLSVKTRKRLIKFWDNVKVGLDPNEINAYRFFLTVGYEIESFTARDIFRKEIVNSVDNNITRNRFWVDVFGTADIITLSEDPRLGWDGDTMLYKYDLNSDDDDYYDDSHNYKGASKVMAPAIEKAFGKTVVFSRYHERKKDKTSWYIEPDGSIVPGVPDPDHPNDSDYTEQNNDGQCEIVTPPLPVKQGIEALKTFYRLAKQMNLYTSAGNDTGIHINVSIPEKLDVLKLAVFAGDEHVIREWGREDNEYVESVIKSLKGEYAEIAKDYEGDDRFGGSFAAIGAKSPKTKPGLNPSKKKDYNRLLQIAKDTSDQHMASVNFNGKYVSFRHAGGDYLNQQESVINVVGRFVRAMVIASDPTLYRKEYLTKLSTLVASRKQNNKAASVQDIMKFKTMPIKAYIVALFGLTSKASVNILKRGASNWNADTEIPMALAKTVSDQMLEAATTNGGIKPLTRTKIDTYPAARAVCAIIFDPSEEVNDKTTSSAIWSAYGDSKIGVELDKSTLVQPGTPIHTMLYTQLVNNFKQEKLGKKGGK